MPVLFSKTAWRNLCVIFVVLLALFAFPQTVQAAPFVAIDVYYYALDGVGEPCFVTERFEVHGRLADDEQAMMRVRFANLLENLAPSQTVGIPQGTRLLGVWRDHDTLFLNVSREILDYGGAANGRLLRGQLLRNAAEVYGAACLVVLVEGAEVVWPEGLRMSWIPIRADAEGGW